MEDKRVLVVDDEKLLVKGIKFNLENDGYEVVTGCDGMEAVELAASETPDLIVLDLMMPRLDGLEACTKIREFSQVPIIMLTAKSEDMDKLLGFEHGADDYLTKPFNILELKARIRALLRRAGTAKKQTPEQTLVCGHITLDRSSRSAFREDVPVDLTAKEFDLMELLMRNPNRVYSRETLLDAIWGYDVSSEIRTVDVHPAAARKARKKSCPAGAYSDQVGSWLLFQVLNGAGGSCRQARRSATRWRIWPLRSSCSCF